MKFICGGGITHYGKGDRNSIERREIKGEGSRRELNSYRKK